MLQSKIPLSMILSGGERTKRNSHNCINVGRDFPIYLVIHRNDV